jgi:hypothetical protein
MVRCTAHILDEETGDTTAVPGWRLPHFTDSTRCYFFRSDIQSKWIAVTAAIITTLPTGAAGFRPGMPLNLPDSSMWFMPILVAILCVVGSIDSSSCLDASIHH